MGQIVLLRRFLHAGSLPTLATPHLSTRSPLTMLSKNIYGLQCRFVVQSPGISTTSSTAGRESRKSRKSLASSPLGVV